MTTDLDAKILHDLKTPLTAIDGYTRLLLGGTVSEKQASWLNAILCSTRIMEQLIKNLVLTSRLDQPVVLDEEKGDLKEIIDEVSGTMARAFESKGSRIEASAEALWLARGADLIESIAANMLLAALNTSISGASVNLDARVRDHRIEIAVSVEGLSGSGLGGAMDLVEKMAVRLEGKLKRETGRYEVSLPELAFV